MGRITSIIFLFTIFYLLFSIGFVYAQRPDDFSLGIFPPVLEITADPPAKIDAKITIQNLNENNQELSVAFQPFRLSKNNDGTIEHISQGSISDPYPLIIERVKLFDGETPVDSLSLGPFESKILSLKINLDKDAPLGDYYFSVIFSSSEQIPGEQTALGAPGGIGTNVILSVGKKSPARGTIEEFSTPLFTSEGPVPITMLIKNRGEQYFVPTGEVAIYNMVGKLVGRLDILPQFILANSSRFMIDTSQASASSELSQQILKLNSPHPVLVFDEKFLLGPYTLKARVKLGEAGPEFSRSAIFFAFPARVVFATSFFAFVLLGIFLRVKKKI